MGALKPTNRPIGHDAFYWNAQKGRAVVVGVETGINAPKVNVGQCVGTYKKKVTTAATAVNLVGLRGDQENEYDIDIYVAEGSGGDSSIFLRPNALSTNLTQDWLRWRIGTDSGYTVGVTADTDWYIGTARANGAFHSKLTVHARSGVKRSLQYESRSDGSPVTLTKGSGFWTATSGELTYFELRSSSASGIGVGSRITVTPKTPKHRFVIRPTDTILFIGDSLVEGYPQSGQTWAAGSTIEPAWDSFAGTFRRMVDAQCFALSGQTPTWRTGGKGGSKVADIDSDKVNRVGAYSADVIISEVGIVDTNSTATTSAAFKASYGSIIDYSRTIKSGCRWLMLAPMSRGERPDGANGGGGSSYSAGIDAEVERICEDVATVAASKSNCHYVPTRQAWQEFEDAYNASGTTDTGGGLTMEGTHPILPGQEWIAALMSSYVIVMP